MNLKPLTLINLKCGALIMSAIYEIIKINPNEHHLIKTETQEVISIYTRMSSAKRGLERLLAKESANAHTTQTALAVGDVGAVAQPPTSNTGGLATNSEDFVLSAETLSERMNSNSKAKISEKTSQFVMVNGKLKEIPLRKGVATAAHIDTLTMVLTHDVFLGEMCKTLDFENDPTKIVELANEISRTMYTIFGFGIVEQKNGLNGYKYSFRIGTDNANYGQVAFGGKRQGDTIMIHLYGDGLTAAGDNWEKALYNWIKVFAPFTKFTRVDLAHDFIDGEYTPSMALNDWINGGFTQKHTRPNSQCIGVDWNNERFNDGDYQRSGKTFYVGSPTSSRLVRVYDKGCELGDKNSNWVRFELQLRNRDYIIPHEILLAAGEYLTGAYPICETLFNEHKDDLQKCERVKKSEEITMLHVLKYASQAASPCINMLEKFGFDDTEIKLLLKGGKFKMPKRLISGDKIDCVEANISYIHQAKGISLGFSADIRNFYNNLHDKELSAKRKKRQDYWDELAEQAEKQLAINELQANFKPNRTHFLQLT